MIYALICTDKTPEGLALRKQSRRDHLDYLASLKEKLKFAGPFTTEDGSQPTGSLVVIEANSLAHAKAIADDDPYAKIGVFESVDVRPWKWLLGHPGE